MNNEIAKTVYEICREMYNEDMQNAVNKVSNEKYGYEIAKVKTIVLSRLTKIRFTEHLPMC